MTTYEFGDVVLVPFPFTDQKTTKKRPAVVVSSDTYNRKQLDLILMAVTGHHMLSGSVGEVSITEWDKAGLIKPSIVKPIFTTIEKKLVVRKLGQLEQDDKQKLKDALKVILA